MKLHRILTCGVVAALCLTLAGCASIITGSHKKVTFKSTPEGATVTIVDKKGKTVAEGITPFTTKLRKGGPYFAGRRYTVQFAKEGYFDSKVELKSTMNGWYLGNLVFGGLLGLIIVDPLTGAVYTLPKEVSTTLNQKTAQLDLPDLRIVHLEDVPSADLARLVRIN